MKKIILLLLFVNFSSFAQECRVIDEVSNVLIINCGTYKDLNTAYQKDGQSISLTKTNGRFYKASNEDSHIKVGESLFIEDPLMMDSLDNKNKKIKFRIFQNILNYNHNHLKLEVPNSSVDVANKDDTLETLPLRMVFDLEFENFGMLLMPDFDSKEGRVGFYRKVEELNLGLFLGTNISNNREISSNGDSKTTSKSLTTGLFVRYLGDQSKQWHTVAMSYIGYMEMNEKNSPDEIKMKGLVAGIDFQMFFKVTNYISLGLGVGTEYTNGIMDIKSQTNEIDTNMTNLAITLSPLILQAHF